ncbi:MAG: hypothetical protein IKE40_02920 [Firmicutes bacterium]|nr:hypothetical protein [Bacillota bacterium]
MNNINEIWKQITRNIKEEMKYDLYNALILPLEPVSVDKEKKLMIIKVPNLIIKHLIDNNLYDFFSRRNTSI